MSSPLVSVICLCYNHARFVEEAIESVLNQTYSNIQLIVVDDASTDNSIEVIQQLVKKYPQIEFIPLPSNQGNCKAFNQGLARAKGEFLIDLATDDVLLPIRIEEGVKSLQKSGKEFGVHFSDAEIISESGERISLHSTRFPHNTIPQGDLYKELISRYFICPPTVMFTREVINHIGGYDETLTYEDFDFWVRSSRKFKYVYEPVVLVKKRITGKALADEQFNFFSKHSVTTFRVCEKILELNMNCEEQEALAKRIRYETKLNLRLLNIGLVFQYLALQITNSKKNYA